MTKSSSACVVRSGDAAISRVVGAMGSGSVAGAVGRAASAIASVAGGAVGRAAGATVEREVLPAGRVEHLHRPDVYPEFGVIALMHLRGGVEPGDHSDAACTGVGAPRVLGELRELGGTRRVFELLREVNGNVGRHR